MPARCLATTNTHVVYLLVCTYVAVVDGHVAILSTLTPYSILSLRFVVAINLPYTQLQYSKTAKRKTHHKP